MERHIQDAVKLYSGDKPVGLFVDKLPNNLKKMNATYDEMVALFNNSDIHHFEKLPADLTVCGQFAKLFTQFNAYLEAAKIQGFSWDDKSLNLDENTYLSLVLRYKELASGRGEGGGASSDGIPFDLSGHLTEIDTGKIDADYMNALCDKYLKTIQQDDASDQNSQKILDELHKSFASLSQEEQKFATIFLHDVQCGNLKPKQGKTFRAYITDYIADANMAQINQLVSVLGGRKDQDIIDFKSKLNRMMNATISEVNINEFGRFDVLKTCVDEAKASAYFEAVDGASLSPFKVNMKIDQLLQNFIIKGGFDLECD